MPKNKKNLVLGAILVVLVGFAYGYYYYQNQDQARANNFVSDLDFSQVDKMVVERTGSSTTLLKQEEGWKVEGTKDFYVRESRTEDIKKGLTDLTEVNFELVSTNQDKKELYHTDLEHGSHLELYQGEEKAADFVVGRLDSPTVTHTYISRPDSEETYLAKNVQLTAMFLEKDWRSKVVFNNPDKEVKKLRFQYPEEEFTAEKKKTSEGEDKWEITEPNFRETNSEKLAQIEDLMTNLIATRIPEQSFAGTGLEKHLIIVEAQGDGFQNTIMVGEAKEDEDNGTLYYAKKGSSDNIYLITEEERNLLKTSVEELASE